MLCHTVEILSRLYDITIVVMSYGGRVSNSYVCDRCTVAMSYGLDVKSYVWDSNRPYVIRMVSPTYEIATDLMSYGIVSPTYEIATEFMSYGRVSKSYV